MGFTKLVGKTHWELYYYVIVHSVDPNATSSSWYHQILYLVCAQY
eukprot:COSAG02_NODE_50604_length_319_cov_1.154545_1_plen_44_part_10